MTASPKNLQRVLCIQYPVEFQAHQVTTFIDSDNKINVITPGFAAKLGLISRLTNDSTQKINGLPLETYAIVSVRFSLQDSFEIVRFFEVAFLLADTSMKLVLGMSFLSFSNADFQFSTRKLTQRSYTYAEALSTARQVELIDKYKFAITAPDKNSEIFIVHVVALEALELAIFSFRTPLLLTLQQDKAPAKICPEYADYVDVFSTNLAIQLPENTGMNEYVIELVESKQPSYRPIYSLSLVELETLKTYIKTYLKTEFICPFKSPAGAPIIFDKKPNGSFCICINY